MKWKNYRQIALCVMVLGIVVALAWGGIVHAQGTKFTQRQRIESVMDNSPGLVVDALERILTADQVQALETELAPPLTDRKKSDALQAVKTQLLRAGFTESDPVVSAVASRASELKVEVPVEQAPAKKE